MKFAFQTLTSLIATIAAMVVLYVFENEITLIEGGVLVLFMIAGAGYFACTVIDMIQQFKREEEEAKAPTYFSARDCRVIGKNSKF